MHLLYSIFFMLFLSLPSFGMSEKISKPPVTPATKEQQAAIHNASLKLKERTYGSPKAKQLIIEYSSLTCPHCADFHNDVWPKIDEKYVKTGKVKITFRHFPFDIIALQGAQLLDCLDDKNYFNALAEMFATQNMWIEKENPIEELEKIAKKHGANEKKINQCIGNIDHEDLFIDSRVEAHKKYNMDSTPTLILNDTIVQQGLTFEEFEAFLQGTFHNENVSKVPTPSQKTKTNNKP